MGVRPPTDSNDRPDSVEFGIAALTSSLANAEVEYPADSETIVRTLEDPHIPITVDGRTVPLSRAMEDVDEDRFDSKRELLNALHPVFEAYRDDLSTGVLSTLRALFPF